MRNNPKDYFTLYGKSEFYIIDSNGKYIGDLNENIKIFETYKLDNKVIIMFYDDPNKHEGLIRLIINMH